MKLSKPSEPLLVQVNIWHESATLAVDAVSDLYLVFSIYFVKHNFFEWDVISVKYLLCFGTVGAVSGAEHGGLLRIDHFSQLFPVFGTAHRSE